jgi:two-component system, OmpR family, response regulator
MEVPMKAGRRERILIVEDDDGVVKSLNSLLEYSGYDVTAIREGASALNKVSRFEPDLVILDLQLPDINGYEVCRNLHQGLRPWTVPILMLTGMDKPVDQLRGFAFGADAYLTKPCPPDELLKTVALLLEHPNPDPGLTQPV